MVTKALRRFLFFAIATLLWAAVPAHAQNAAYQGWCEAGATSSLTSGIASTTLLQVSYPSCTVTVFLHGGGGLATGLTQDAAGQQPLSNPFTAQTNGQYFFYLTPGTHVDIQLSGGLPFPGFPSPLTITDVIIGGGGNPNAGCSWPGSQGTLMATNGAGGCQPSNLLEVGNALQVNDNVNLIGQLSAAQLATFNSLVGVGPTGNYFVTFTAGAALSSGSLVKLTAAGTVTPTAVTDLGPVVLGVYIDNATAPIGAAIHVATFGPALVSIDSQGCTAGQSLINSPTTPGTARCTSTPANSQVIGQSFTTLVGAGAAQSYVFPLVQVTVAGGGGGGAGNPGGLSQQLQYNLNGQFAGAPTNFFLQAPFNASPGQSGCAAVGPGTGPCDTFYEYNQNLAWNFGIISNDTLAVSRGNGNRIAIQATKGTQFGSVVQVFNAQGAFTTTPYNPGAAIQGQSATIGANGTARGGWFVGTDDYSDTASGQTIIGATVGAGLSKLSGSIATAVGLDVLGSQSFALNGSGVCCNTVTESATNIYGIRIGQTQGFATGEQAGILIQGYIGNPSPTPNLYSIKAVPGSGAALFGDGVADSTLTPGNCVQTQIINSLVRLVSAGSVCGTAQATGPQGAIQFAGVGGAFSGDGLFTRGAAGNVLISLANLSTDISPFTAAWATNNAGVTYGGVKLIANNTSFAAGTRNFQVCGGAGGNNCFGIDPFGDVFTPGTFSTGPTGVAGSVTIPQGPLPGFTLPDGSSISNAFQLAGPTSIPVNYQWFVPAAAAAGIVQGSLGTNAVTLSNSGDSNHALSGTRTSALTTTTLCSSGNCPQGEFVLHLALQSTVTCATPGPATITPTWTFTDAGGAKSSVSIPMQVNGSTTLASTMGLGNTTNWASNLAPQINSTGVAAIQLAIAYTACTSGTGTYHYAAEAVQVQ